MAEAYSMIKHRGPCYRLKDCKVSVQFVEIGLRYFLFSAETKIKVEFFFFLSHCSVISQD